MLITLTQSLSAKGGPEGIVETYQEDPLLLLLGIQKAKQRLQISTIGVHGSTVYFFLLSWAVTSMHLLMQIFTFLTGNTGVDFVTCAHLQNNHRLFVFFISIWLIFPFLSNCFDWSTLKTTYINSSVYLFP